ncbi:hypothetical protein DDB_G0269672 [Dictyostelium discoideum AX4]|uniref:Uncharacterized protein n=1 Tax=Dictyostelium discoideum TaxID=44689 RepID=Q55DF9_DICDI|nr:hypothetical protein DDB_G0269672 [Dictyostelium discoideum AX4]EAL72186.1 hypothetical protein DDB_G0269672 [Dictyostelium discoideum AX4]|eukprot:XP_646172.1 hypothetical protein DDB_G0269672 [Dictyostelium discoideum AX4]
MNKLIVFILLVVSLACVFGELEGVQPQVCKMKANDCNRMHQAYLYATQNGDWKDMPKDAQELFLSVYKNNC